ncbi:hypothetical protein H4684_001968 [Desulfomicrobium macestii]|uniref:Uncharacterized protein n=1 Tax=Desulfomicrobium macestii TaxID=90731 RepID=A0ABR9H3Q3_9BACT|nr:hypothetical protein [Desulfomicrobium macestii]
MAALFFRQARGREFASRTHRSAPRGGICQFLECIAGCGPKDYTVTLIMELTVRV